MAATLYGIKNGSVASMRPILTTAYGSIGRSATATASFDNLFDRVRSLHSRQGMTVSDVGREALGWTPAIGPALDSRDAFNSGRIGMGLLFAAMAGLDVASFGAASKVGMVGKTMSKTDILKNIPKNIHYGAQGKHIKGYHNFDPRRSLLTGNPEKLLNGLHSGEYKILRATKGNPPKPIVDFGETIGIYKNIDTGVMSPTSIGQISYKPSNKALGAHIVPANPNQY